MMKTPVKQHLPAETFEPFSLQKKNFKMLQRMEMGCLGISTLSLHLETKKEVFVKQLFLNNRELLRTENSCCDFLRLMTLKHKYILTPLGFIFTKPISIITPNTSTDTLDKANLNGSQKTQVLIKIASGLRYLHRNGVIHGDLKAKNVFVEDANPILADFGIRQVAQKYQIPMNQTKQVPYWDAPEVIQGGNVTEASDVYSFGILALEMLLGTSPFNDFSVEEFYDLVRAGIKLNIPNDTPSFLKALVLGCTQTDPLMRPSIETIWKFLCTRKVVYSGAEQSEVEGAFRDVLEDKSMAHNWLCQIPTANDIRMFYERIAMKSISVPVGNSAIEKVHQPLIPSTKKKYLNLPFPTDTFKLRPNIKLVPTVKA